MMYKDDQIPSEVEMATFAIVQVYPKPPNRSIMTTQSRIFKLSLCLSSPTGQRLPTTVGIQYYSLVLAT